MYNIHRTILNQILAWLQVMALALGFCMALPAWSQVAPVITYGPTLQTIGDTSVLASYTQTGGSMNYLAVLPAITAAPTAAQIAASLKCTMWSGSGPMASMPVTCGGLSPNSAYVAYMVAESNMGSGVFSAVVSSPFTTLTAPFVPALSPAIIGGPTIVMGPTTTDVGVSVNFDQAGTFYYSFLPATSPAPTIAELVAGGSTGNHFAFSSLGLSAYGLIPNTAYVLYFVAKNAADSFQATVSSVPFTTLPDGTAPVITAGPTITDGPTTTSVGVSVTLNEAGKIYAQVLPASSPVPSVTAVVDGGNWNQAFANTPSGLGLMGSGFLGLTPNTAYVVYVVAQDIVGNVQAAVTSMPFTTNTLPLPGTTGPTLVSKTPYGATISVTVDQSGHGYWAVLPSTSPAPSVADMVNVNVPGAQHLDGPITANQARIWTFSCTPRSSCTLYFVATDDLGQAQAQVSSLSFVLPAFTTTGPTITSGPGTTTATFGVTINDTGTGYWQVLPSTSAPPSPTELAASGSILAMTAGVASSIEASGLAPNTAYVLHFVAKDSLNNLQTAVTRVSFTTLAGSDTTPPVITAGPTITSGPTDTTVGISVTFNEAGSNFYMLRLATSPAPTVTELVTGGVANSGWNGFQAGVASGLGMMGGGFAGLTPNTAYVAYFVAKDTANNLQTTATSVPFTTLQDTTPPVLTAGPTITSGPTHNMVAFSVTYNEPGHIYSISVLANAAAPTPAQVKAMVSYDAVTVLNFFDTVMLGNTARTVFAGFPSPSTAYKVYFVAEDSAGNLQAAPSSLSVTTTASPTYPVTLTKSGTGAGTVTSTPAGIDCGATCSGNFTSGSSVTLSAAPTVGSTFSGWSGDCTGLGNCVLSMGAAKTVTASFTLTPTAPISTCNPCSLSFSAQNVGTTSAPKTATLTNTGNAVLNITSLVSSSSVFGLTHNCGASLAAGASCTVNVTFTPTSTGTTTSSIVLTDNAAGSPHVLPVSGVGVPAGAPVCTLVANPSKVSRAGASTLTASCTNSPTSYSWTGGTCVGNTTSSCHVTPVLTTTYAVTGTNAAGSHTASATVTVLSGDITPILFLLLFD